MTVSLVARRHGVGPNQLFMWRHLVARGGLTAAGSGEEVRASIGLPSLQNKFANFIGCSQEYRRGTRSFARDIGLEPRTTPIESLQCNGMAEAFVRAIKSDYVRIGPTRMRKP